MAATLYLARGSACYRFAERSWAYYAGIEASEDGIFIGLYLDNDCDRTVKCVMTMMETP